MIFFTADTHLGHENIIKYCNRPFNNVREMDEAIINNWNSVVKKDDLVYHLGDFCFKSLSYYTNKLNGNIILIKGNHDFLEKEDYKYFNQVYDYKKIKFNNQKIILFHYPMRFWDCSHHGSWHLYGHIHGSHPSIGLSHDVGVDVNGFKPISFTELKTIMELKTQHEAHH